MDVTFDTADVLILRLVLQERECDLYRFHQQYRLTPVEIMKSIGRLTDAGIVKVDNARVSLAEGGLSRLFQKRHKFNRRPAPWKEVPDQFLLDERIDYHPDPKKIDRRILKRVP